MTDTRLDFAQVKAAAVNAGLSWHDSWEPWWNCALRGAKVSQEQLDHLGPYFAQYVAEVALPKSYSRRSRLKIALFWLRAALFEKGGPA